VRLYHLPHHLQRQFDGKFVTRLREYFGYLSPWEIPADEKVQAIWNNTFPSDPLASDTVLKFVVNKLVGQILFSNDIHLLLSAD
jgi:hypothetical protein